MVTLSFTIFSGQKNYNRAHMLFQVLCGFEPIFYTTHPNEESIVRVIFVMGLTYRYLTAQGIQMIKIIRQTTYADLKKYIIFFQFI